MNMLSLLFATLTGKQAEAVNRAMFPVGRFSVPEGPEEDWPPESALPRGALHHMVHLPNAPGRIHLVRVPTPAPAAPRGASASSTPLSAEYRLVADPELIFLADTRCCCQTAATVAERPGWETLTAVTNGAVVEVDDDVASRWGPRIVNLLRVIVDSVNAIS